MQTKKLNPVAYKFKGRIFRVDEILPRPGDPTVPTETDIVPSTRFAREMPESEEEYKGGTFEGRRRIYLYFRNPGYEIDIQEGDKAELTIRQKLTVWNIDSIITPDTGRGNFCLECSRLVEKVVAPAVVP